MKRLVQTHRQVVEVPRGKKMHEHFDFDAWISCDECNADPKTLIDARMRQHYGAEAIPWNSAIRQRGHFIPGMDG